MTGKVGKGKAIYEERRANGWGNNMNKGQIPGKTEVECRGMKRQKYI